MPLGLFGSNERRHQPGILIVEEPEQEALRPVEHWTKGEYRITAVARYDVNARVVLTNTYWFGREAELSPIDFLLAWGVASDQRVQDSIRTSLSSRYYRWKPKGRNLPVDSGSISESMANTHLIPGSDSVLRDLKKVEPGALVRLSGFLVNVKATDGWRWNTSLTRRDAGGGACELMWVDAVYELDRS
jgi:hypothetical protein